MWWRLLVVPLVAVAVFALEVALSYRGRYVPPPLPRPPVERIALPSFLLPQEFQEAPARREKTVLVDTAHSNLYDPLEVDVLFRRLVARGTRVDYLGRPSPRDTFLTRGERLAMLEEKLRFADAFLTLVPADAFTPEEVDALRRFVEKGGRLLLLGDPHRPGAINSLANAFGITFAGDYLYNLKENGGNYQYVFFTRFAPDPVTAGLQRIALFTVGSLTAPAPLAVADENTFSSIRERYEALAPLGRDATGRVLAVGDLTFLGEPFNAFADNDRFIANLADFLTGGERAFTLADFPYFFQRDVDVVAAREALLASALQTRTLLARPLRQVRIQEREDLGRDTVFLALFEDRGQVAHYLAPAGVEVGPTTIAVPLTPPVAREGTGLILLSASGGRRVLLLLAEDPKGIEALVERLESGAFRKQLVNDMLGLYPGLTR
ncbi:hypothetical protein HRbin23_00342 [bacterium HR23]|nr:hypothetical protein HRbin23_00342 [bacterium HR23]